MRQEDGERDKSRKIVVSRCQGQREEGGAGQQRSSLMGRCLAGQRKDNTMRQNDKVDDLFFPWPRGKRAWMRSAAANVSSFPALEQKYIDVSLILTKKRKH